MFENLDYKQILTFIVCSCILSFGLWFKNTTIIILAFILLFVLDNTQISFNGDN